MINYSNFCRDLKKDFTNFLYYELFEKSKIKRPELKLIFNLFYGVLKSGSTIISEIARAIPSNTHIGSLEVRLTTKLEQYDLNHLDFSQYVFSNFSSTPTTILIDESDVIKPYGIKFEDLTYIHDGSKEGRPKEKGYDLTGILLIGLYNNVFPLVLNVYSKQSPNYKSLPFKTREHITQILSRYKRNTIISMDRGYDGKTYINPIEKDYSYVIRAKENRKYITNQGIFNINELMQKYKCKYSTTFINSKNIKMYQKFISVEVRHQELKKRAWLVIESVNSCKDKRVYLTNIDCSTKEGCILALKSYRLRWRVEEFFRFIKTEFCFEKFRVRKLKAINNLTFIVSLITTYISRLSILKNKSYYNCLNAYKSFKDKYNEENVIERYGKSNLELYRLKRGIQEILSHSKSLPFIPGYVRKAKANEQLCLFEIND